MMRIAGFSYGLLLMVKLSQAGSLMGLFLGLWTADALKPHDDSAYSYPASLTVANIPADWRAKG